MKWLLCWKPFAHFTELLCFHPPSFPTLLSQRKVQKFSTLIGLFLFTFITHYSHCNYKCAILIHLLLITLIFTYLNTLEGCLLYKRFLTWHQVNSASLQNFKYGLSLNTVTYLEISFLLSLLSFNHAELSLSLAYLVASGFLPSKNIHFTR